MKKFARNLAVLTAIGMACGQAYAHDSVTVADSPVHAVPSDDAAPAAESASGPTSGPVEVNSPPNTLNAQFAAQNAPQSALPSEAPAAPQSRPVDGPSAAVASRIINAAGAFQGYIRKATAIDTKFADGEAVSKAVFLGAGYEIAQFQEGATAYVALAALQDPAFVQGVYDLGRDPRDRAELSARILAHPESVMDIDGADEAAARVGAVLAHMGFDLVNAGAGVKQSSYEVQHQAWSKEDVPNAEKRLAEVKARAAVKASMNSSDTDALVATLVALRKADALTGERNGAPSPVVLHGLAIAALAVYGHAGEAQINEIAPLLTDAKSADCMKMAKLNLYQCMAAAGPEYEDVFCLGAHAMIDTGQCVIAAAGQTPVPTDMLKAQAPARAFPASIAIPMNLTSTAGPERQRAYARAEAQGQAQAQAQAEAPRAPIAAPPPARDYAVQDQAPPAPTYAPAPRQSAPRSDYYDDGGQAGPYDQAPPPARPAPRQAPQQQRYSPYADPYTSAYANPYANYYGYYGYGR